jgi:hypothetical protein
MCEDAGERASGTWAQEVASSNSEVMGRAFFGLVLMSANSFSCSKKKATP